MKKILVLILLFCSVLLNAATNIVSWNPPAGGLKKTYSDSYTFYANAGDILSCKCNGLISAGSSVNIYLTVNGERNTIYTHSTPHFSFNDVSTYQFKEDGEFTLSYSYTHSGGGTTCKISINATLNDFVKMTSLSLDTTSLLLDVGNNYRLNPIIVPEYASNKTIEWVSSDESIATISSGGVVTALKAGATMIYASSTDGTNYQTSCKVAVRNLSDHHDYIDLGLPSGTLWATTNIGASSPEEQGYNYAWGELYPSGNFWSFDSKNYTIKKYNTSDNLTELEPEDDVATVMWGNNWKLPTKDDFQELIDNCVVTYDYTSAATATELGTKDYVTLKITAQNGNYILLPQSAILASNDNIDIIYWTSSINPKNVGLLSPYSGAYSYRFQTSTNYNGLETSGRWRSCPIRPICKFIEVQELSILPTLDLNVGETNQLEANITPYNATDPTIVWSSNNDSIAIVGQDGKVTAIKSGIAEIRAMTTDGSDLSAICRVSVHNPVTSVNLNINSAIMHVTESLTLQTICTPIDADDSSITWTSSNNSIVTVDNGIITAIGVGNAVVTASSVNGLYATCNVSVETTYANSLTINKTSLSLVSGEQETLTATILPSYTTNKEISWKSSAEDIVTVSNSGVVRAISTGNARITATTSDGTCISATCDVSVTTPVKTVQLDKSSEILKVGESIILQASCFPSNADNTTITWVSSDNTVATVVNGVVTAITLGEASITASSVNGIEAKCSITVVPTPVSSLEMNESTISIVKDQTFTLSCTIFPDDATNKELIWSSEDEGVAKVNDNGVVTGVSTGNTIIYVKAKSNSKISANCKVFVTTPVTSIKLDQEQIELYVEDEIQLRATCSPTDADNTNIRWSSSDSDIADVSNEGYVKTKNEGNVRITVTTTDGTNLSASCDIIVRKVKQYISWNTELSILHEGGEMAELVASSSSGLPVRFNSSDNNVVSIFDLGDVVYANPVHSGKVYVTSFQEGNYKYEPAQSRIEIEVVEIPSSSTKTLIAYYSQSTIIDGIVLELANQITSSNASVFTQKIEPTNDRINSANTNSEVRDSVMNTIALNPNVASSYPTIKTINANINDYDNVIMVYPLWNSLMAAPMQTFNFNNKEVLRNKSVAFIEYDLFDDAGLSSNTKVLRLNSSNIEDLNSIIEDWLSDSEATGILQLRENRTMSAKGIYDLHGRKLTKSPSRGIYIENGIKVIK